MVVVLGTPVLEERDDGTVRVDFGQASSSYFVELPAKVLRDHGMFQDPTTVWHCTSGAGRPRTKKMEEATVGLLLQGVPFDDEDDRRTRWWSFGGFFAKLPKDDMEDEECRHVRLFCN